MTKSSFLALGRPCVAAAGLAFALLATGAQAAGITLNESGSTLLYPLFNSWAAGYRAIDPQTTITTAATGSGAGTQDAITGDVRIGTSDAYFSDEIAEQNPQILNIPLAIAAQTVNYNLPGLNNAGVKLGGGVLAGIYAGRITSWDDAAIKALNPGVALPHQRIIPVRRADASGDSFIFTQFLDFTTQSWEDNVGYGTSVSWPAVAGERTATGNAGMVQVLSTTPYAVGYTGISFRDAIAKAGLGTAPLENQNGKFLLPTADTISAAAAVLDPRTPPDERLSLVYASGDNSYPLINYEYAVVSTHQPDPAIAAALRKFLLWSIAIDGGNAPQYLTRIGFVPLPDFIRGLSEAQIAKIQ